MGKKEQSKLEKEEKDDTMPEVDQTKGGKKSKKSKRKDFDEDDIAKELEEMSLEANGGELPKPTQANSNENEEPKEDSKTEAEKSSKGKKGKNKRRGKDDDDEEIDDLLAELEAEYKGEPLPEKSGEKDSKSDDNAKKSEKSNKKSADTDSSKAPKEPAETKAKAKKEKAKPAEESKKSKKASEAKANDKKSKATEEEEEDESKSRKGKPNKKMLEAMKAAIAKQKEVEEKYRQEQKERDREEQERVRQLKEKLRLEKEKKEKQKLKQKERLKKLKEGGKILTNKQKLEQKRAQAMLEHLRAQGLVVPGENDKLVPGVQKRPKKKVQEQEEKVEETPEEVQEQTEEGEEETAAEEEEIEVVEEGDDVVDDWDQLSGAESGDDESEGSGSEGREIENGEHKSNDSKHENEIDEEEEDEEDEKVSHIHQTEAEKRRERAQQRMEQRKIDNENTRSTDRLRAPVVCVLGHVDHGKTKILDKLRRTNVQEGEVGGITQQIGATNVPLESIRSQTRMVKDFDLDEASLPGLLIIDTPGHESFSNLRSRGSSLCDIAILVVDITQGLEPQTLESINLLKKKKTPFVVALNKVDRVFEWESYPSKDIRETIRIQNEACQNNFQKRNLEIIQALNIQGLNAALFWENPDPRSFISLVPTSAISGDGMGNLMSMIVNLCQKRLAKRLMFSEELQCTVLEVKTIQGHGVTIDVILINGQLKEGDTIILAGTEGPIVTQIRSLLTPKPMKEIRVKGQYDELKVVQAALGVKLAAKELEKAIAGLNLQVAHHEDEIEILKEEVDREFKAAMRSIKVKDKGVYVQASTLGALEALLEFFKTNSVPYSGIRVGPVVKRDVMRAAAMLEHNPMYAVILAFDVKVERDAQELADKEGIKIFSEETIYHLGDRYVEYIKDFKKKKQDEFRHVAVFPCKLKILPDSIFNKRDPIVLGVTVDSGILRTGTILCVPSKEFVEIGVVSSLEFDHKVVEIAKKGVTVCIKIEPLAGHTPKLFGRHFDAEDLLVSRISRESIDACKEHFRDDLGKNEWKLMAELKKQFCIL